MKRLTFNAAMQQFHEQFPRVQMAEDEIPEGVEVDTDGPMPWDDEIAEDMG